MFERLYVKLDRRTAGALSRLSAVERRHPSEQAAYLLSRDVARRERALIREAVTAAEVTRVTE
jgi:hypothetical protein